MNESSQGRFDIMLVQTRRCLRIVLLGAFASLVCLAAVGDVAFAQNKPVAAPAGKPAKRTSINFEDQLIEGQAQKPELFYLLQQRNNNYKRLIRLRENFLPEMRKTAEDISR